MMRSINVYHYDAFSTEPNKGNPAGVVLQADALTTDDMQQIALQVGFNETAFAVTSEVADVRIRFFTPGHEMNLCGHATMATVFALYEKGLLQQKRALTIETNAGILPITLHTSDEGELRITMQQAAPQFQPFTGSKEALAQSIGLSAFDLHEQLPIVYGSTGTWTLLVPINNLEAFQNMTPNNELFPNILHEMPKASVHPFCFETHNPAADMHARHFSSPYSGTIEDAVTGTASGVMGAFYAQYIQDVTDEPLPLIIEQGHEIGKDGQVLVHVSKRAHTYDVNITGVAVYVDEWNIMLD